MPERSAALVRWRWRKLQGQRMSGGSAGTRTEHATPEHRLKIE